MASSSDQPRVIAKANSKTKAVKRVRDVFLDSQEILEDGRGVEFHILGSKMNILNTVFNDVYDEIEIDGFVWVIRLYEDSFSFQQYFEVVIECMGPAHRQKYKCEKKGHIWWRQMNVVCTLVSHDEGQDDFAHVSNPTFTDEEEILTIPLIEFRKLKSDKANAFMKDGIITLRVELVENKDKDNQSEEEAALPLPVLWRSKLVHGLSDQLDESVGTDVGFKTKDGVEVTAHRVILMAGSPVFKALFESLSTIGRKRSLSVPYVSSEAMEMFLKFLYSGETKELEESESENDILLVEVLALAENYEVVDLEEFTRNLIQNKVGANASGGSNNNGKLNQQDMKRRKVN